MKICKTTCMSMVLPVRLRRARIEHPTIIPQLGTRRKRLSIIRTLIVLPLLLAMLFGTAGCSESFTEALLDAAIEQMEEAASPAEASGGGVASATPHTATPHTATPDSATTVPAASEATTPDMSAAETSPSETAIPDLAALHDPEIFTRTALEHIFVGSVNSRGVASGYHTEAYPHALGEVIAGTRSAPDQDGVYEAKVRVDGVDKTGNRGYSTFYPLDMPVPDVVQAIREAYETRAFVTGNTWRGEGGGLSILMYLDDEDRIISAFPEYGG